MEQVTVTFWGFVLLLLVYVPLVLIWGASLVDVFRRDDMGGVRKVVWLVVIVVLPVLGTLLYLLRRPQQPGDAQAASGRAPSPAEQVRELRMLTSMLDRGTIEPAVFTAEARRVVAGQPAATVPPQPTASLPTRA